MPDSNLHRVVEGMAHGVTIEDAARELAPNVSAPVQHATYVVHLALRAVGVARPRAVERARAIAAFIVADPEETPESAVAEAVPELTAADVVRIARVWTRERNRHARETG